MNILSDSRVNDFIWFMCVCVCVNRKGEAEEVWDFCSDQEQG